MTRGCLSYTRFSTTLTDATALWRGRAPGEGQAARVWCDQRGLRYQAVRDALTSKDPPDVPGQYGQACGQPPVVNRDPGQALQVELTAVIVALMDGEPLVLTIRDGTLLPSGPFASADRSLQASLRAWVEHQTGHPLGYVEQLYTFADRDRSTDDPRRRVISISYLGLTRPAHASDRPVASWQSWYRYFPWEDWRGGAPTMIGKLIAPRLRAWAAAAEAPALERKRLQRARVTFGFDDVRWNEEMVLQRYELLFEAGLVPEAVGGDCADLPGVQMQYDHRRILATGIARLRAKIKYRPVVFELMPECFTLLRLQRAVEALAGQSLHKQNFRRLIDSQDLVEETGKLATETGGRPAKLFRFRPQVLIERAISGTKLPLARST
jgi:hypothetical protein